MADYNPLCARCQVSMTRERNGVKVKYSARDAQYGDLFECPACGSRVITGCGKPYPDAYPDTYDYVRGIME